jgi:predicted sulfurtransferase
MIVHPHQSTAGIYVQPGEEWDTLLNDPSLVIDVRNDYKIQVGTFENAINPNTKSFIDIRQWIQDQLVSSLYRNNKIIFKIKINLRHHRMIVMMITIVMRVL